MAAPKHYGLVTKHGNKRVRSMVEVARRLPHTKRLTFVRRAMMLIAVKHGEVREPVVRDAIVAALGDSVPPNCEI